MLGLPDLLIGEWVNYPFGQVDNSQNDFTWMVPQTFHPSHEILDQQNVFAVYKFY